MSNTTLLTIENGSLRYKEEAQAVLAQLCLTIEDKGWNCILGKSGCGKTSLLRFLAGLLGDDAIWHGELHSSLSAPLNQHIAYMAQQDLLLPWLTITENVCLPFQLGNNKLTDERRVQAAHLIEKVGLTKHKHLLPAQLSGGMRQRVALARTLMQDKPLVLMDEPFSALDAVTRHQLQNLSVDLLKEKSVVLITHDPQEALRLGDHVYLMQGSPAHLCSFPVPKSLPPRKLDGELASLQQQLIEQLEHHYV